MMMVNERKSIPDSSLSHSCSSSDLSSSSISDSERILNEKSSNKFITALSRSSSDLIKVVREIEQGLESVTLDMMKQEAPSDKVSGNVEHIEALLRKINEENKRTKEVLDAINRNVDIEETTTRIILSKGSHISLKKDDPVRNKSDSSIIRNEKSVSKAAKLEDSLFYETTIDGKKVPVTMFNYQALSRTYPLSNGSLTVGQKYRLTFKTVNADAKLISQICHAHGFHEVHSSNTDYNLSWTGAHPKPHSFKSMLPHQRVNHFPRSYELTRKDRLYQNIERLQHAKGAKNFNFVPKTFMIPVEYSEFAATHHRMRGAWIVKPVASSRGRGIFIVNHPSQVPLDEPMVVAKYIDNPLLVNGHKWDLRLYVSVTSYDPLMIYLYEEGLVRFATVKYDSSGKNLWNPCMHLCNYSINKYHSDYIKCNDPNQEDQGHKWSLSALLRHLKAHGIDTVALMQSIEDVIVKSIISVEFPVNSACKMFVPNKSNCFELYGFDILIDSDLKPWLLEVNLSPSLNCDAPIDMKIKSAMLCDLLNLVGVPAVDPVLKRAQFNKKVNELVGSVGNDNEPEDPKKSRKNSASSTQSSALTGNPQTRRNVSVETRRFAAIRLAASSITYQQELTRMIRNAKEQYARRGGWVRIFPTVDSWSNYGALLEYSSQNNLILHEQLFPNAMKKNPKIFRKSLNGLSTGSQRQMFETVRKRSQSVGPASRVKSDRLSLSKSTSSTNLVSESEHSSTTSNNNIKSYDDNDKESPQDSPVTIPTPKPSAVELRVAQYEKPLTKGHCPKAKRSSDQQRDKDKAAKKRAEKMQRSKQLRDKVVKMIEGGQQLSEYQARKAFSVYLTGLLQRLSSDFSDDDDESEDGSDSRQQIELILKFLQKAALSLREPYFLKSPSSKLNGKDRAAIVAKELSEFLGHYRRETELFTVFKEEQGMVPRHTFDEFVAFANCSDLEDVLTLQTKLYRCAHIFLGKCMPPVGGRKNALLRTAYGISPDRNVRDRQCSMRVNARANPPVAPQFMVQSRDNQPVKCKDITTYEKSRLEELEEMAEMEDEGSEEAFSRLRRVKGRTPMFKNPRGMTRTASAPSTVSSKNVFN